MSKPNFIVADPDDGELFTVSEDGVLYTKSGLDRETKESFKLTVIADRKTKTGIHHATIFQIRIMVDDENDNAPEFQKTYYEGSVLENCPVGTLVQLNAPIRTVDRDMGPNAIFSLTLNGEGKHFLYVIHFELLKLILLLAYTQWEYYILKTKRIQLTIGKIKSISVFFIQYLIYQKYK